MEKILSLLLDRLTLNLSLARMELKNLWQISLSLSFFIDFLWGVTGTPKELLFVKDLRLYKYPLS